MKSRYEYIKSSFSVHQQHVISLIIHGFLPVNARLLIAFCTAFYSIISIDSVSNMYSCINLFGLHSTSTIS